MTQASRFRPIALAGALLLALVGVESAQAMPAAPALSAATGNLTTVQYERYPGYRYRRFNRHRRAGIYGCGPHALSTHLERRACR